MPKAFTIITAVLLCLFCIHTATAQKERPKIGLVLSGGGAKGIAHVGLLKAIDSAGLKVDYVTGTSMGAVVGGVYAAGYSADTIYKLAQRLDWATLLSNDPPLKTFRLKEREDFGQYIEIPLNRGKISLKLGLIESNELWMKLAEFYYPFYETNNFGKYKKGFQCIATDVGTGKMVVLKSGSIVNAVRASMAIPSVFTPVEIDGKVLIDGGLVRNFPVSNVREMGADIVIGSDVSGILDPIKQAQSPLDIISRLPFYKAASDLEVQKKLVNLYVDYPLDDYSTASFSSAQDILKIGMEKGKLLYPEIKRLKDSLDLIYGRQDIDPMVKMRDSVFISEYEVQGIPASEAPFFIDLLRFTPNTNYTAKQLSHLVRTAFAVHIYGKIHYELVPGKLGTAKIIFDVEKLPSTFARFGFHYNTTTGIAIKTGLVKRGLLSPFSIASCTFSIGENPRGKATYSYFFTKNRQLMVQAEINFESIDITTYDRGFNETGLYNQASQNSDFQLLWQPHNKWTLGLGTSLSTVSYDPKITAGFQAKGKDMYFNSYFLLQHNSLNTPLFPIKGCRLYVKAGLIYGQKPSYTINIDNNDGVVTERDPMFNSGPYTQLKIAFEKYIPLHKHALLFQVQSGLNFNYRQAFMNDFMIGGLNDVIRNQVTFAGLPEASVFSASVVSAQVGYQHAFTNNLFLTAKVNGLYYDFIKSNYRNNPVSRGIGYSLTAGYKTFLGPIETSLMYSDLNKKILPYFNIGYVLSI